MRLLEFSKQFGGEEACKQYFKEFREKQGLSTQNVGVRIFTGYLHMIGGNVKSA
jgi:hypothetical protein